VQNLERAETLREYILKLLTRAKIGQRDRFVLFANGNHCFGLAANINDVNCYELSSGRGGCTYELIFSVM
jgi:hypothetical protein